MSKIQIQIKPSIYTSQKKQITKIFNNYKAAEYKMEKLEELIILIKINKNIPPGVKYKLTFSSPSFQGSSNIETVICNLENLELYYKRQKSYVEKVDKCLSNLTKQEKCLLENVFLSNTSITKIALKKTSIHRETERKILKETIKKFLEEWNK